MTSPDFTYPQPTDDELAAQQPRTPSLHAPLIYSSPGTGFDHCEYAPHSRAAGATRAAGTAGAIGTTRAARAADPAESPALGKTALILSILATVLTLAASALLGATVDPAEAASGYYFTDTPDWYQGLAIGLVALQALCACLGTAAIVMGIVSTITGRGRTFGIVAIAAAAVAPFASFGTFLALSFAFA
jgi:hypothetical protein